MAKRLQEYVKYKVEELESYVRAEGSCVRKINTDLHLSLGPYCLSDFKHALKSHIMRQKVGYYDAKMNGIVLDIKNIKVLSPIANMRADDPRLHVDINANCYVFCPAAGSILSGVVKHVGRHHIGVIVYRVFNVSIRLTTKVDPEEVKMDDTVQFCIKNFNLQNVFPYIEGDLVSPVEQGKKKKTVKIKTEFNDSTVDSGIERDSQESTKLISTIKKEQVFELEKTPEKLIQTKEEMSSKKRKRKASETANPTPIKVKIEKATEATEITEATETKKKKNKKSKGAES